MREGTAPLSSVPPLLFIAFFTSHRSPLSERLEQAKKPSKYYIFNMKHRLLALARNP